MFRASTTLALAISIFHAFACIAVAANRDDGRIPNLDGELAGRCGSVDLVLLLDKTNSMGGMLGEIKREALNLFDLAMIVSNGELRMGLVAFDDAVEVIEDLDADPDPQTKLARIRQSIMRLRAHGGDAGPEASDEALNTAVNAMPAEGRPQNRDFQGRWVAETRIVVLITDNFPGGFNDHFEPGVDDRRAMGYAQDAADRNIRISTIYVPTSGLLHAVDPEVEAIMRGYASTTGGLYSVVSGFGGGTAEAIASIIKACGWNPLS